MSTQVQYRRGTATENNAFTGALAEITVDTTNWTLRVHNGSTPGGGGNIATVAYVTAQLAALSANSITDGTSNVKVYNSANIAVSVAGTANVAVFKSTGANITGTLDVSGILTIPTAAANTNTTQAATTAFVIGQAGTVTPGVIAATGSVGTSTRYAREDHVHEGVTSVTASTGISTSAADGAITLTNTGVTSAVASTGISVSGATGAVTFTNTGVTSAVAGTGVSVSAGTGAVTFSIGQSVATAATPSFAGLTNSGANGVGNIGSSTTYFNTVFAKATSAQYADLAEMYQGDESYMPGTVVEFGGSQEITITTTVSSPSIAGVVSTNPSYLMNSGLTTLNSVPVALTGRVPCQVLGPVRKGDRLVSSMIPGVAQAFDASTYQPGCIIGKSLEDWSEATVKSIEVVVGRV